MIDINEKRIEIQIPSTLNASNMLSFLRNVHKIFTFDNKLLENYALNLSKLKKINVLGMLVIYKIIEYSVEKKCFHLPLIYFEDFLEDKWGEYDFIKLINSYIKHEDTSKNFRSFKINVTDNFILAPQPLIRESNFTNDYLRDKFLPKINEYYIGKDKVISMISTCFSEILLNFWEHAVNDTKSIMIADGNKNYMEIACADTGNGIISTLKSNPKYSHLSDEKIILKSTNKNVTSKENTNHMGFGLWIINEIVTAVGGRFHLYSEGVSYINDYGKIKTLETSYWKGTIVYLALPLQNAKSLNDIDSFRLNSKHEIKIDFI